MAKVAVMEGPVRITYATDTEGAFEDCRSDEHDDEATDEFSRLEKSGKCTVEREESVGEVRKDALANVGKVQLESSSRASTETALISANCGQLRPATDEAPASSDCDGTRKRKADKVSKDMAQRVLSLPLSPPDTVLTRALGGFLFVSGETESKESAVECFYPAQEEEDANGSPGSLLENECLSEVRELPHSPPDRVLPRALGGLVSSRDAQGAVGSGSDDMASSGHEDANVAFTFLRDISSRSLEPGRWQEVNDEDDNSGYFLSVRGDDEDDQDLLPPFPQLPPFHFYPPLGSAPNNVALQRADFQDEAGLAFILAREEEDEMDDGYGPPPPPLHAFPPPAPAQEGRPNNPVGFGRELQREEIVERGIPLVVPHLAAPDEEDPNVDDVVPAIIRAGFPPTNPAIPGMVGALAPPMAPPGAVEMAVGGRDLRHLREGGTLVDEDSVAGPKDDSSIGSDTQVVGIVRRIEGSGGITGSLRSGIMWTSSSSRLSVMRHERRRSLKRLNSSDHQRSRCGESRRPKRLAFPVDSIRIGGGVVSSLSSMVGLQGGDELWVGDHVVKRSLAGFVQDHGIVTAIARVVGEHQSEAGTEISGELAAESDGDFVVVIAKFYSTKAKIAAEREERQKEKEQRRRACRSSANRCDSTEEVIVDGFLDEELNEDDDDDDTTTTEATSIASQDDPDHEMSLRVRIVEITTVKEIKLWKRVSYGSSSSKNPLRWMWGNALKGDESRGNGQDLGDEAETLNESTRSTSSRRQEEERGPRVDQRSDPPGLVTTRVNFLLSNPHLLPKPHFLRANSECVAVWCKTGRWSTYQASSFLNFTAAGQAKSTATVALYVSSQTVTVRSAGFMGWLGFTTQVPLVTAQPLLLPLIAGYGIVTVAVPLGVLLHSRAVWASTTKRLNDCFWSVAGPDVFVECIRYFTKLS